MAIHSVDKLMAETRRLAVEYHRATQQTLPVTPELARYDVIRLLHLSAPETALRGVDAVDKNGRKIQIKGRVIFDETKNNQRLGSLNQDSEWDDLFLLTYDENYDPTSIYACSRKALEEANEQQTVSAGRSKRGTLSLARFKHLADVIWPE